MADMRKAFPGKYLGAADIEGDMHLTIRRVVPEEMDTDDRGKETKYVCYFQEADKGLVLNKTNTDTVMGLHGFDSDLWVGKRITLFTTEVSYGGKQMLGVRVRMKAPPATIAAPAPAAAATAPVVVQKPATEDAGQWKLYCFNAWAAKHPEHVTKEARGDKYRAAVTAFFPGREPSSLGTDDWKKFDAENFGEREPGADDEIPF